MFSYMQRDVKYASVFRLCVD